MDTSEAKEILPEEIVSDAIVGCHIAHFEAPWIIGTDPISTLRLKRGVAVPDFSIDPEEGLLSVLNPSKKHRSYYITVNVPSYDADENELTAGTTRDENGVESKCTTFILSVPPRSVMDVCYLDQTEVELDLYSHISDLTVHPNPNDFDPRHTYQFPLQGEGPYLCTQGCCGQLTHFTPGTFHALDFRCPVGMITSHNELPAIYPSDTLGTPVLAVGDCEVIEILQSNTQGGVHAKNLFVWNSVLVRLDDGVFVEYVHIKANSVKFNVGDKVACGEVLCESGDVGFCPEPHLHIQMHLSNEKSSPTIKFAFKDPSDKPFFPIASKSYNANGQVEVLC